MGAGRRLRPSTFWSIPVMFPTVFKGTLEEWVDIKRIERKGIGGRPLVDRKK